MKKLILSLALIFTTLGVQTAQAIDFDWGVTGGMNLTKLKMSGENESLFGSKNRAGWFVGPKIDLGFALGLGMDASVLFQQTRYNLNAEFGGQDFNATHNINSISIPLNARYNIGLGDMASIYIATGPQFDFGLGEKEENWFKTTFQRKNLTTTWNIGAGVKIAKHVEIGVGYNIALGETGERVDNLGGAILDGLWGDDKNDYRANSWKLHATYYF